MKYTVKEIEFLKENYPKYGGKYCQKFLQNRNLDAINAVAKRYNLSAKNKVIHPDLQSISVDQFLNINEKEVAYFLGYFWADGNIINYKSNNMNHWRISFEINSEDANSIMNIMDELGKWSKQIRQRKKWKETTSFVTNNKDLFLFLFKNDYSNKSIFEPTKILSLIPNQLHKYFWKGLIDGDGSIGLIGRGAYFEISSTYDYQYKEVINLFKKLKIDKYYIYQYISKYNHKSSVIKVYGKEILKLESIFIDYGLSRKTSRFYKIKEKYV